jgi:hypothetical protein
VKRVLVVTFLAGAWHGLVIAQRAVEPSEAAIDQRAIYPDGTRLRVNPMISGDIVLGTRHSKWDVFEYPTRATCGPEKLPVLPVQVTCSK